MHNQGYKISGFLEAIKKVPPLDGSDWTIEEKESFHSLMKELKSDVRKVAARMGKSVNSCLAFHYRTVNVRQTRSSHRVNNGLSSSGQQIQAGEVASLPSTMWDIYFIDLEIFKKEHGHCLVPKYYDHNQTLSHWVYKQRR